MRQINNDHLIKMSSYISVFVAVIIMLIKAYGWLQTSSQSILASLMDSLLDISSSLINLFAVRIALLPPDENHRFGHEKFQDLAVFSQSIFFFISCILSATYSIRSLFAHEYAVNNELGANLMIICIVITSFLVMFQSYVIKKTQSTMVQVDKLHYFADLMTNVGIVASLYISAKFWYMDAIVGVMIAIYIFHGAWFLFRGALKNLVDEEFSENHKTQIVELLNSCQEIKGWHDLKTRWAGNKPFIQLHIELPGANSLISAHYATDIVSAKIIKLFPNAEVIIHQDPV